MMPHLGLFEPPGSSAPLNEQVDARVWAEDWKKTVQEHPDIAQDEGTMIGWFANAIMAGYDHGRKSVLKENQSWMIDSWKLVKHLPEFYFFLGLGPLSAETQAFRFSHEYRRGTIMKLHLKAWKWSFTFDLYESERFMRY